jgi:hypothetical protein
MELTKKSVKDLHNRYTGCGILFVKIGDSVQMIEFNLGKNGKFYTMNGTELPERLNELSRELKVREMNG